MSRVTFARGEAYAATDEPGRSGRTCKRRRARRSNASMMVWNSDSKAPAARRATIGLRNSYSALKSTWVRAGPQGSNCQVTWSLRSGPSVVSTVIRRASWSPQCAIGVAELHRRYAYGHARYDFGATGPDFATGVDPVVRASRHELRIAFDVDDQREHVRPAVVNSPAY
jgi:hypothetical protein